MPFANRTLEEIRDGILRDIRLEIPGARTEQGSRDWVQATALANQLLPVYANGQFLADRAIIDPKNPEGLLRWSTTVKVPKQGEQFSRGTARVSGTFAATIADGTTLVNKSTGARYAVSGATTIDGTSLVGVIYVIALQPGAGSDADSSITLTFEGTPAGVNPEAVVISISGGDSAWSDTRWASEIAKRIRATPRGGNIAHVRALCLAIAGVEEAFVYPALRGAGTIDVVILTSAATGSRIAGTTLLAQVVGALQNGVVAPGTTDYIGGLEESLFRNTNVSACNELQVAPLVSYQASAANDWESWPPFGPGSMDPTDPDTWYVLDSTPTSLTTFDVTKPITGAPATPEVGSIISMFFESVGFAKAKIVTVLDTGPLWRIGVDAWSPKPTAFPPIGREVIPWNPELPALCGPPVTGSQALSGAIPDYFASLGPGEMTALTVDDDTRRRRWPRTTDVNPITAEVDWPTDITGRLAGAILRATDARDVQLSVMGDSVSTPPVPHAAYIGAPPTALVLGVPRVIPIP
jgi:uncharacterized phage protein gp47/JayE